MRLLITGGTGFVGGHLLRALAGRHELFAFARNVPAGGFQNVTWIEQDLAQPLSVDLLPKRIDAIVALAQSRRFRDFPEGARDVFEVNVRATFDLLEYGRAAGAGCFAFASTGGLYGQSERAYEREPLPDSGRGALGFYLDSKRAAESLVRSYSEIFRYMILRPFFVYGPGPSRMLVRTLTERVLAGEPVTVSGDPGMRINPIYVEDVVRAIVNGLESEAAGTFNLAGDEEVTVGDLVALIGEVTGREADVTHTDDEVGSLVGDNARMREQLGIKEPLPIADGLRELARDLTQ